MTTLPFTNTRLRASTPREEAARDQAPVTQERLSTQQAIAAALADGATPAPIAELVARESAAFLDELPEEARAFAPALARHCARAVERARLGDAERRACERLARIAQAGELLAASIDYETTLDSVARCALPALGDYAFLDVPGGPQARARRLVRSHGGLLSAALDPLGGAAAPPDTEARLDPVVDGEVLRRLAARPEDVAVLRRLGLISLIRVPLVARAQTLGVLTLAFGPSGRRHTTTDLAMAKELAHRAAIAVENALLHRACREAMEHAQEAEHRSELCARAKDEFLGVVSHELRTPLNAVLGWSQLLRGPSAADPAVLARGLSVIDRNARAQARLIEDLLDVSRIITGKLQLSRCPVDLDAVVLAALEVVRPAADAKGIDLCSTVESGAAVSGDPDRLQQVVWNLVSNAVKFTPEGGRVEVALRRRRTSVRIVVSDSGRGIDPELLPHVFERFWQADSSPTRRHGGLGLGLAIARHLVELHGGSVCAKSAGVGLGSTFTVRLPAREEPGAGRTR